MDWLCDGMYVTMEEAGGLTGLGREGYLQPRGAYNLVFSSV
jgi:hypothetical protein